jgi:hypothetical protein
MGYGEINIRTEAHVLCQEGSISPNSNDIQNIQLRLKSLFYLSPSHNFNQVANE